MERFSKRRRGRPCISEQIDGPDSPEFFKVYLAEHNSHKLLIPPGFLEHFKGEIPEKVILRSPLNNKWEIKLEKEEHKVFMTQGWNRYVKDISLDDGEFLVFRYDDNYAFTVKKIGVSGCREDENPDVKVELEDTSEEVLSCPTDSSEQNDPVKSVEAVQEFRGPVNPFFGSSKTNSNKFRFVKVDDGKKRYEMHIPVGIIEECNVTRPRRKVAQEIVLRNQHRLAIRGVITQRRDTRVVLSGGWRLFYVQNRICAGDAYELEIVLDQWRRIQELVLVRITPRKVSRLDWF